MKTILIAFVLIITFSLESKAQLTIIDGIAGTLIPAITKSVKEIWDPTKKKEDQVKAKKELDSQIELATKNSLKSFAVEANNIERIRKIFELTRRLNSNVGALKALTTKFFIDDLKASTDDKVKKSAAAIFNQYWANVNSANVKLQALNTNGVDVSCMRPIEPYFNRSM